MKLLLDCSQTFDPWTFVGRGWRSDGWVARNLPKLPNEVDFGKVVFENGLRGDERRIPGMEKLRRVQSNTIMVPLGGEHLQALWRNYKENRRDCVLEWLRTNKKITLLYFFGSVLLAPPPARPAPFFIPPNVLFVRWNGFRWWTFGTYWLGFKQGRRAVYGVLSADGEPVGE